MMIRMMGGWTKGCKTIVVVDVIDLKERLINGYLSV